MTAHRDFKKIIRDRQLKTGESYTSARAHVLRDRAQRVGEVTDRRVPVRADAVVLKVNPNRDSGRLRILGETGTVTFRSSAVADLVPGHLVTLAIDKRWTWRDDAYASGRVENPRIEVARLGLEPLSLQGGELEDLRSAYEPVRAPDPYAPLWRRLTSEPRRWFEMDARAWGGLPDRHPDDYPVCHASELAGRGDVEGARAILMDVLCQDLRCLDAHAHLGNLAFDRRPEQAILHYAVGVAIGELSLPPDFDGVLVWGALYNRPFLRCLQGLGLCHWRMGRTAEALAVFERILALNPNDNQGVRFCREALLGGAAWEDFRGADGAEWN
jgi:hypothetical protein